MIYLEIIMSKLSVLTVNETASCLKELINDINNETVVITDVDKQPIAVLISSDEYDRYWQLEQEVLSSWFKYLIKNPNNKELIDSLANISSSEQVINTVKQFDIDNPLTEALRRMDHKSVYLKLKDIKHVE